MNIPPEDPQYATRYVVLFSVMFGIIPAPIDASMVNVILPTLVEYFDSDIATAQWVPMIYLLTVSSLLLFYGRLGEILGYKKVFLYGLAGFTLASGLCGLSPNMHWLIIFRAIQGLAAGMLMAVPYAIITASFPPAERGKALGIYAISISAGLAIGPSVGGFITSLVGWRATFLINIPIGIAGLLFAHRSISETKGEQGDNDFVGAVLGFVFLFALIMFFNRLQASGLNFTTLAMLGLTTASAVGFVFVEAKTSQPMLDLLLFRNVTFSVANVAALLNYMSQYVLIFLTPFFLHRVMGCQPAHVGEIMTAFPLAVMLAAPLSGSLSDRIGSAIPAFVGAGLCSAGLLLMSFLGPTATPADVALRLALFGLGTGIFQSPNTSAAMSSVPQLHLGTASAVLSTTRNVGMVMGIAVAGLVLHAFVPGDVLQKHSLQTPEAAYFLSGLARAYATGAFIAGVNAVISLVPLINNEPKAKETTR